MKTLLTTVLGFTFLHSFVHAQEGGGAPEVVIDTTQQEKSHLLISVEANYTNSYLWRGIEYNHGLILQPAINLEYKGFTFNIWNNSSILETKQNTVTPEIDYTLSKVIETGHFYFEPALQCYTYLSKNSLTVTAEASLFAAYYLNDYGIFINPVSDFLLNAGGSFSETGFSYDHETDKSHVVLNMGYGVGNKKFSEFNIFNDETVTLHSIYQLIDINGYAKKKLNENIYIKPSFNFFHIIGSDYKNFLNTNQLNFAFSIGAEF